jgi:predicted DNA-binding protein
MTEIVSPTVNPQKIRDQLTEAQEMSDRLAGLTDIPEASLLKELTDHYIEELKWFLGVLEDPLLQT